MAASGVDDELEVMSVPPAAVTNVRSALDSGDVVALAAALGVPCRVEGSGDARRFVISDVSRIAGLIYCPLCAGALRKPAFLSSCAHRHYFCSSCIWLRLDDETRPKCPSCGTHFTAAHISEDAVMGNISGILAGEASGKRAREGQVLGI